MPDDRHFLGPERPNSVATEPGEFEAALAEFDDEGQTKTALVLSYLNPDKYRSILAAMALLCPEYHYPDRFRNGAAFTLRLSQGTGKLWYGLLDNLDREVHDQFWRASFPLVLLDEADIFAYRAMIERAKGLAVFISNQTTRGGRINVARVGLRVWVKDVRFITPGEGRQ